MPKPTREAEHLSEHSPCAKEVPEVIEKTFYFFIRKIVDRDRVKEREEHIGRENRARVPVLCTSKTSRNKERLNIRKTKEGEQVRSHTRTGKRILW